MTSCIYLTDYWVMWEVLLCTVSTVTLSEIRLLKKKKEKRKESLLFDITPYNNSIYKRFHLLHKSSRTKQQITNYTRQRTNKDLYISRVVCVLYQKKNLYKTLKKKKAPITLPLFFKIQWFLLLLSLRFSSLNIHP